MAVLVESFRRSPASPRRPPAGLTIPCAGHRLVYRGRPLVMGVLNVTPDSFSDGGLYLDVDAAVTRGCEMAGQGADLIDVGGVSTRPGSQGIPVKEELQRVLPVVKRLVRAVSLPVSVDTSSAQVAAQALDVGAAIINDITALRGDSGMASVIARGKAAMILMHMRGTPRTMQRQPRYQDVGQEVAEFLAGAAEQARAAGIDRQRILIDPGLGFGKTVRHNLQLLQALPRFVSLGYPVVVGPSRKSFIGKTLGLELPDRLAGTLACVAYAQRSGAHMVRVHDVQETVELVRMWEAIEQADAARRQH